jgi:hypothetical protein
MVARNQILCTVVAVPVPAEFCMSRGAMARDLLPWADPYVAQLIKKLQDEVRHERRMQSLLQGRAGASFFSPRVNQPSHLSGQEK